MEQSKALSRLLEAADLVGMLEDLTNPAMQGKLSTASYAGMRHTLHSIREIILSSHDTFAATLVAQARSSRIELTNAREESLTITRSTPPPPPQQQRDLRASLEKFVEK